ncbi:caspase family protein [Mesorhizobium sp. YC-39]|uniref:caspase family protein n=1 Tax=unclassified Mesorhizobium TaxID=325217 RepID=UPI0021E7F783|nr:MULTISPECIES: caspase family protein [unclassified Mesorhizobium]MCV3207173.1 caspase family protein [Mesorhizobium sp. YC-2]MCV3228900.1 caspase family protein [Mesorhizobium sp. YC-39]
MKAFAVFLSGFILFVIASLGAEAAAPDTKRVALVIGNSKYVHAVALPNPANDAHLIASTLRNAGFQVIEGVDQDNAGMHSLISRFTEQSYDADLAVIFYAGHGMQVDGKNFLIPVDAELTSPAYLKTRTIQIDDFMAALPPEPAVGVIILDACRDNPLARTLAASMPKSRSTSFGAGLAPVEAKSDGVGTGGILIAYATDPGAIAFDGNGVNSPYSTALARHLTEPGVEIQSALTRVRGQVTETTQGRQRPWHNASLGREVFMGQSVAEAVPAVKPVADTSGASATAIPAPITSEPPSWEVEQRLWDEASKRNSVPFYEAYLDQFPNGRFATVARLNIDQLNEPKAENRQVAAVDEDEANASSGSAVRTSVGVSDEMKQAPGTELTESAIGLDREGRIDLQLRIEALGNELGRIDGNIGLKTRQAIGVWQAKNGLPQTNFLTREQLAFLAIQTDPMMATVRARYAADQARAAQPKKQVQKARTQKPVVQKARTQKPVAAHKPRKQQQVVQKKRYREVVRRDAPPPRDNNDFLTKALIFGTGVAVGGVLNNN